MTERMFPFTLILVQNLLSMMRFELIYSRHYFFVTLLSLVACMPAIVATEDKKPANHSDGKFRNPYVEPSKKNFFSFLKMKYFEEEFAEYKGLEHTIPQTGIDLSLIHKHAEVPQVTWIGHSTALVQYKEINILTDPVFSDRASPVSFAGPKRYTKPALTIEQLPDIHYAVISHNHYDHLDAKSVRALGNGVHWFVPLGVKQWFNKKGVTNVTEFDWWDSFIDENISVTATPSQHWSARGLHDRYATLWAAWSIQLNDFKFWFAGDTGYNPYQFKETGEKLGPFDLGIIPIGGYGPRWFMKNNHVNPGEAIAIHNDVNSRFSFGVHWGTFQLTSEPVIEPKEKLEESIDLISDGTQFITLDIGETRSIVY